MQLSDQDKKRFPAFGHFLSVTAPRLKTTSVVSEMAELTGLPAAPIRQALTFGTPPRVLLVANLNCRGSAAGCFRHDKPDQIEVSRELVDSDEKGLKSTSNWKDRSFAGITLRRSHVTVLHELVHWADFKANSGSTAVGPPYHDIGSKWEWLVLLTFDESMIHRRP
jgi:hypothetical protein